MQNKKEDSKMDKTGRDSGCSASEGRLWGGLHNSTVREMVRNGEASPSSKLAERSRIDGNEDNARYRLREYAKFETLVYYFNEEWFNLESAWASKKGSGKEKSKPTSQPHKCSVCKRPWSKDTDDRLTGFYYMDTENFKNIPMLGGDCPECQK